MKQIVVLIPFSLLVYTIGSSQKKGSVTLPDAKRLAAWGILFLVLVLFADFPETATLASALAWLIALTVFLTYGTATVDRVSTWTE